MRFRPSFGLVVGATVVCGLGLADFLSATKLALLAATVMLAVAALDLLGEARESSSS
jgi:hypothetical protein